MTSKALVPYREGCLRCGEPTRRHSVGQLALIRHGGYGATRLTTFETCPACSFSRVAQVCEVRPARRERIPAPESAAA